MVKMGENFAKFKKFVKNLLNFVKNTFYFCKNMVYFH